ncbi:MAG: YdeI/OmpD-associated family protein [Saprospiraceae bacterium]
MLLRVSLKKDTSEYGLPMPEEMAEVLAQDDEGDKLFHALTPGKIRTLLYIAGNVKSSEKRISRSIAIVEHLKETKGKIDFKMLNIKLKESQV